MIDDDIYSKQECKERDSFYFSLKNVRMMFLSSRSPLRACDSNPVHSEAQIIL